jgi:hypothetical protein
LDTAKTVSAGADGNYCTNQAPVTLTGIPEFGTWSGPGVTPSGKFSPSTLSDGVYNLSYTYCGKSDVKQVTIRSLLPPSSFYIKSSAKVVCSYDYFSVTLYAGSPSAYYRLYINNVDLGNPTTGTTNQYWQTKPTGPIMIIKVTESLSNSCGIQTTSKYDTVYMSQIPKQDRQYTVDSVCEGTESSVRIFDTEIGCRYWLGTLSSSYSDTIDGNGGTIKISASFSNNSTVEVAAINKDGCKNKLNLANPPNNYHAYIRPMNVNFSISSEGGWIGEPFTAKNNSNLDSYIWNIDGTISTKVNPDTFKFATNGIKTITLIGNARFQGCADTLTRKIEIVDLAPKASGTSCSFDTLVKVEDNYIQISPQRDPPFAFHVDKDGNRYVSTSTYYREGASYQGGYGLTLRKFDKDNKLIWEKRHNPFEGAMGRTEFVCNFAVDIESDNAGNIYVAGHFSGNYWKWDKMVLSFDKIKNMGYLMKLNSKGIVQWVIHSESPGNGLDNECSFTDIIYVDDDHIYAAATHPDAISFPDGSVKYFNYKDVNVLAINKDAKLINSFSCKEATNYSQVYLYTSYYPIGTNTMYTRSASLSPKMALGKDGNIYLAGKSNKMLSFDTLTYDSKIRGTAFMAVLDPQRGWKKAFSLYSIEYGASSNVYNRFIAAQLFTLGDNNDIYVADYFIENSLKDIIKVKIGGQTMLTTKQGGFTAKYDLNGNLKWFDSTTYMSVKSILALDDELITYGDFNNYYAVTTQQGVRKCITAGGPTNIALTSYTSDGNIKWMETIANDTVSLSNYLIKDRCANNAYLCGITNHSSSFVNNTLKLKSPKFFIGKYAPKNDCSSKSCVDCAGVLNGSAFLDSCGTCAGGTTGVTPVLDVKLCKMDCAGMINGIAFIDTCGICAGGATGITPVLNVMNCKPDCAGVPRGKAFLDSCKTCAGGTTGIVPILDKNKCKRDCASVINGKAFLDSCQICAGGTTGILPILDKSKCKRDCAGVVNGKAFIDSCKICSGGATGIIPILDVKLCKGIGIDKFGSDESKLSIYPNPSLGKLFINSTEIISEITINNAIGETVFSIIILNGSMNYSTDISTLPDALYFIVIKTKKSIFYRKIILVKE